MTSFTHDTAPTQYAEGGGGLSAGPEPVGTVEAHQDWKDSPHAHD